MFHTKGTSAVTGKKPDESRTKSFDELGFFSKCFYTHLWPLSRKARASPIQLESRDFDNHAPGESRADDAYLELEASWQQEVADNKQTHGAKRGPHLWRALARTYGLRLTLISLFDLFICAVSEPAYLFYCCQFIDEIAKYLAVREELESIGCATNVTLSTQIYQSAELEARRWETIFTGSMFCLLLTLYFTLKYPHAWWLSTLSVKIRSALCRMIYEKSLRIDKMATEVKFKQAMSLISRDIDSIDINLNQLGWLVTGPMECLVLYVLLSGSMGFTTGCFSLALNTLLALQRVYMNIKARKYTKAASELADERVAISSETFHAIRVLRMCSWTSKMAQRIDLARKNEMVKRRHLILLSAIDSVVLYTGVSVNAILTLIFGYYYADLDISQANISRVFLVTQIMRRLISRWVPMGFLSWVNMHIVCSRCSKYLVAGEIRESAFNYCEPTEDDKRDVQMESVALTWPNSKQPTLEDINFSVNKGELLIVAGKVGSGKSTLLHMILGELVPSSGCVRKNHLLSYASQEAWIFAGTVRDNILMGEQMEPRRYTEVLRVCSLMSDLQAFLARDLTQIGDRGITLSGGQKARVNLARCLYQRAEVYLLDDPLSAVDSHVAQHIFSEAVEKFLADKSVILVTHQLQFLPRADKVLVLEPGQETSGSVSCYRSICGTYEEIVKSDALANIKATSKTGEINSIEQAEVSHTEVQEFNTETALVSNIDLAQQVDSRVQGENEVIKSFDRKVNTWVTTKFYLRYCGTTLQLMSFGVVNALARVVFLFCSLWLSYWAGMKHKSISNRTTLVSMVFNPEYVHGLDFNQALDIVWLFYVVLVFVSVTRSVQFVILALRGARKIHQNLIYQILYSKMSFFDVTPLGDIVNRVSTDLQYMDTTHVAQMDDLSTFIFYIAFMFLMTIASEPAAILALVPVILMIIYTLKRLARVIDISKKVDGIRRSAVYSHLGITLDGLSTIRATKKERNFLEMYNDSLDRHLSVWFLNWTFGRWLMFCLDAIFLVFYISVVFFTLYDTLNGGGSYAFVAIYMVMTLTRIVQNICVQMVQFYINIQSLDRIRQYEHLDLEERPDNLERAHFTRGHIEFLGVSLKYNHTGEIVLRDLTLTIEPCEKIGIVGRTGAGKSSIISILFRLYHFEGFVFIDGQDIKQLDLDSARSAISIIPQDPVLFSGTLRQNLDPLDEYQDEQLWRSLRAVQMHQLVSTHSEGLEMSVTEAGANFSVGQRQLICLARTILKRNRILILDEATANVDPETDRLIQEAIRREFAFCTVLTVAHRLNTIVDSDRVMVMDSGRLVEFGTPSELLLRNGLFAEMIDKTGLSSARDLRSKIGQLHY